MHLLHPFTQPKQVTQGHNALLRQKVEEGDHSPISLLIEVLTQIGYDKKLLHTLLGELALYLKGAQTLHLVTKEVDAVGILRREGEDVNDASAQGILSRLIDIIYAFKAVATQHLGHKVHIHLLPLMQFERFLL